MRHGAIPYIPFKSNSKAGLSTYGTKSELWDRMLHFYNFHREEFLSHYHKRSNVETTFSMMVTGCEVKARPCRSMKHSARCFVTTSVQSVHELGIKPMFLAVAAQQLPKSAFFFMSEEYFSYREFGARPRDVQEITPPVWRGIVGAINSRVEAGAFGLDFPRLCEDGGTLITGTDETTLAQAIQGEIPDLEWPLRTVTATQSSGMFASYKTEPYAPATAIALDLVEFCWRHVAQPDERNFHSYYSHAHLDFERESGRQAFAEQINRIFARNGLAYELRDTGRVERLAPPVLRESLRSAVFLTGDDVLDGLLETARNKFLSHDPNIRRESVEKLWDAWERLKTLDTPSNKLLSIQNLLDQVASEPTYRSVLETEARALTDIGNTFQIRHHEIGKPPISVDTQLDYLFHRLFAFILLILQRTQPTLP